MFHFVLRYLTSGLISQNCLYWCVLSVPSRSLLLFFSHLAMLIWAVGIFGPFQLHFQSFHANLKSIHGLDGSLSTGRVVKAYKTWKTNKKQNKHSTKAWGREQKSYTILSNNQEIHCFCTSHSFKLFVMLSKESLPLSQPTEAFALIGCTVDENLGWDDVAKW